MRTEVVKSYRYQIKAHLESLLLYKRAIALGAIMTFGLALRIFSLGSKSIWLDEAFSIAISQRSLPEVLHMVILTDTHPPLYYLALSLWLQLGSAEVWVRSFSVLFSTASIYVIYKLAEILYQKHQAGLIAAVILAFSPFQIWYGQETRMYAMLTFLVLASSLFFIRALRHGDHRDWLGHALFTAMALYTDNGAIWYVIATGLFFTFSFRHFRDRIPAWAYTQVGILILYLPWVPNLLKQTRLVTENFWLPPPSFQTVLNTFLDFNSFNFPWMAISILYMTAIMVFAYIIPDQGNWQRPLVSAWLFIPLAVSLLLSLRQPIFLSRNLIAASLGYYLLVTGTILKFNNIKAMAILLMPLLVINVVSIGYNTWFEEKEDWRTAAAFVAHSSQDFGNGLLVFVPGYAELPFDYYFDRYDLNPKSQGYPQDEILLHPQPKQVVNIPGMFADQPIVWLVLRDVEVADPKWKVKNWLDSQGYVRIKDLIQEELTIILYIRWDKYEPSDLEKKLNPILFPNNLSRDPK